MNRLAPVSESQYGNHLRKKKINIARRVDQKEKNNHGTVQPKKMVCFSEHTTIIIERNILFVNTTMRKKIHFRIQCVWIWRFVCPFPFATRHPRN